MKKLLLLMTLVYSLQSFAQNVGISTNSPAAKLHIKGTADASQLLIDANATQSNSNPLILLRTSSGSPLMNIHTDAPENIFIGFNAGILNNYFPTLSGDANIFIGYSAGNANVGGRLNTVVGANSFFSNASGNFNVALGDHALYSNISGSNNTAIGRDALRQNINRNKLVAVGDSALFNNSAGIQNTALGSASLYSNTIGLSNTAIGYKTLYKNTDGSNNTANGKEALLSNTIGNNNTANGFEALQRNTTGSYNTALGLLTLHDNESGEFNTAVGSLALQHSTGHSNVAVGGSSLGDITTGNFNSALGYSTAITIGLTNATAIGANSKADCSNCLVLGSVSGVNNGSTDVNVGIGQSNPGFPLNFRSSVGDKISFFGNSGAHYGIGIQNFLFQIHTDGSASDIAFGYGSSGSFSETMRIKGNGNAGIGVNAPTAKLSISATGSEISGTVLSNIFRTNAGSLGANAGDYLKLGSFGFLSTNNSSLGIRAYRSVNGSIWQNAGLILSYDVDNSFNPGGVYSYIALSGNGKIGIGTDLPQQTLSVAGTMNLDQANANNGTAADLSFGFASGEGFGSKRTAGGNQFGLDIYTSSVNRMSITNAGFVGINTTAPTFLFDVNGVAAKPGGGVWAASSDARLKQSVQQYTDGLSALLKINPVRFHYNELSGYDSKPEYVGVIAQELRPIAPYMVNPYQKNGETYYSVDNSSMVYMLINAVKEQQKQIDELKKLVETQARQSHQ